MTSADQLSMGFDAPVAPPVKRVSLAAMMRNLAKMIEATKRQIPLTEAVLCLAVEAEALVKPRNGPKHWKAIEVRDTTAAALEGLNLRLQDLEAAMDKLRNKARPHG